MTLAEELERCKPWIEAALEYADGTHTYEDIVHSVSTGHMQLWPADDACAVTEIVNFPRKRVLHIFLAGGNMDTIVEMDKSAKHFARINECDAVTIAGRKGWSRVLSSEGYSESFTVLRSEL